MIAVAQCVEAVATGVTKRRLRVLAYHGVDDQCAFSRQMRHVGDRFQPVTSGDVVAAFAGGQRLPERAVWVTFDDGLPSVVEQGLPVLEAEGISATMFLCPGLVDSGTPNWWDVIETARRHHVQPPSALPSVSQLKCIPDNDRRRVVSMATAALHERGISFGTRQLRADDLARWIAAGHDLGNHSWDHPCLDQCEPEEQARQVVDADRWLSARHPDAPRLFAYPNGNATTVVEQVLADLEYDLALLFDHRLARTTRPRYRVSRLRVSSTASDARFAAILSGAHSSAYRLKRSLLRTGNADTALRGTRRTSSHIS